MSRATLSTEAFSSLLEDSQPSADHTWRRFFADGLVKALPREPMAFIDEHRDARSVQVQRGKIVQRPTYKPDAVERHMLDTIGRLEPITAVDLAAELNRTYSWTYDKLKKLTAKHLVVGRSRRGGGYRLARKA